MGCGRRYTGVIDMTHQLVINKVLVVQTGKLGDMVCSTPVFRAIKERFPGAAVFVAGAAINKDILTGNPNVAEFWDFRAMDVATVRGERFDVAVLLTPNPAMLRVLQKARVQKIIVPRVTGGYSPYMSRSFRLWSLFATRVPHRMGHYAPQEYLNMLVPIGIESTNTKKELCVDNSVQAHVDQLLAPFEGKKRIAIAPGAGNKIKEWPSERFAEVAAALATTGAVIVLIGGSADAPLARTVAGNLPQGSVLDTTGNLSIEELKAVVRRMDLFVSVDTGPIYIAEAFDVPTVDIVGPMDEREQPPRGERHMVVVPPREAPELHIMNARMYDEKEARRQVEATSAAEVIAAAQSLLKVCRHNQKSQT